MILRHVYVIDVLLGSLYGFWRNIEQLQIFKLPRNFLQGYVSSYLKP